MIIYSNHDKKVSITSTMFIKISNSDHIIYFYFYHIRLYSIASLAPENAGLDTKTIILCELEAIKLSKISFAAAIFQSKMAATRKDPQGGSTSENVPLDLKI